MIEVTLYSPVSLSPYPLIGDRDKFDPTKVLGRS